MQLTGGIHVCLLLSHTTIEIGTRLALRSLFVLHVLDVDVPWGGGHNMFYLS